MRKPSATIQYAESHVLRKCAWWSSERLLLLQSKARDDLSKHVHPDERRIKQLHASTTGAVGPELLFIARIDAETQQDGLNPRS